MSDGLYVKGLEAFIKELEDTSHHMHAEVSLWLEAMGFEFLEEIQNQIIEMEVVDTRRLLNSFDKGNGEEFWKFNQGKLQLEVGTNVEYAQYVNDGHWNAARTHWTNGRPYFDLAFEIFRRIFDASLDYKLGEWLGVR